jgi:hypothetical protein
VGAKLPFKLAEKRNARKACALRALLKNEDYCC